MPERWVIKDQFGFDKLAREQYDERAPGPGEVRVRVRAAALNFRDLLTVTGLYNPKLKLPLVPCSDGAGEVLETGPGVTRVKTGDRVCTSFFQGWIKGDPAPEELRTSLGGPLDGTLREEMVLSENGLAVIPDHLSFEQAATLPCAGVTAWSALNEIADIKAGDTLLTLGTGGVSLFALQFARAAGARVISTTSSDEKAERLKALGAEHVINYKETPKWGKAVKELTGGRGVDIVTEVGGAETLEQSLQAVRLSGTVVMIGNVSGITITMNLRFIIMSSARVQGIFVGPLVNLERINRLVALHKIVPVVDRVFEFGDAAEAMKHMQSGKHVGKVVIRV